MMLCYCFVSHLQYPSCAPLLFPLRELGGGVFLVMVDDEEGMVGDEVEVVVMSSCSCIVELLLSSHMVFNVVPIPPSHSVLECTVISH